MAAQIAPNQYVLHGDETTISFETTSVSGRATFDFKDGETRLQFTGANISSVDAEFGKAVRIMIDDESGVGDSEIILVIPEVRLRRPGDKVSINALLALRRAAPTPQPYTVMKLRGTAAFVTF